MNLILALATNHRKALRCCKGVKPQITQMPADQGSEYICANQRYLRLKDGTSPSY
ncbi:MAG: hypothetical protein M0Z50_15010 [Planctomycetia bacterium]|nr:hypothetical protein [Planctomycetia bacterium]